MEKEKSSHSRSSSRDELRGKKPGRSQEARDGRGCEFLHARILPGQIEGKEPGREARDERGKIFAQSIILPGRIEGKETREKSGSTRREGVRFPHARILPGRIGKGTREGSQRTYMPKMDILSEPIPPSRDHRDRLPNMATQFSVYNWSVFS